MISAGDPEHEGHPHSFHYLLLLFAILERGALDVPSKAIFWFFCVDSLPLSDSFAYPFPLQKNSKRNLIPSYPFFLTIAFYKVKMPYGDSFYRRLTTRESSDFKGRQTCLWLEEACNINMCLAPPERLSKTTNRLLIEQIIVYFNMEKKSRHYNSLFFPAAIK